MCQMMYITSGSFATLAPGISLYDDVGGDAPNLDVHRRSIGCIALVIVFFRKKSLSTCYSMSWIVDDVCKNPS